jgi:hypothetical protein
MQPTAQQRAAQDPASVSRNPGIPCSTNKCLEAGATETRSPQPNENAAQASANGPQRGTSLQQPSTNAREQAGNAQQAANAQQANNTPAAASSGPAASSRSNDQSRDR